MFILGPATINLPPAYYTYASLAAALAPQGLTLDVRKAPDRVILLSIHDRPAAEVASALAYATGDIVTSTDSGWRITENPKTKIAAEHASTAYLADYGDQLSGTIQTAIADLTLIQAAKSKGEKLSIQNSLVTNTPRANASATLARDMDNGEFGRSLVFWLESLLTQESSWVTTRVVSGTMGTVEAGTWPTLGRAERLELSRLCAAFQIDPNTPTALQTLLSTSEVVFGLRFDPLTGGLGGAMLMTSNRAPTVQATTAACLVPTIDTPLCSWEAYLSPENRKLLTQRKELTQRIAESSELANSTLPHGLMRTSVRLLKWSQSSGKDLIFPVTSLTDIATLTKEPIPTGVPGVSKPSKLPTFGEWLEANASGPLLHSAVPSWIGPPYYNPESKAQALTPGVSLTATYENGMLVFRDELAFLDELTEFPESQALELDNRALANLVGLEDLIEVASSPKWLDYKGGACCAGLQDYDDFPSSVPFLALLEKNETLRREVKTLQVGKTATRKISTLSLQEQRRFTTLLEACSNYVQPGDQHSCNRLSVWNTKGRQAIATGETQIEFTRTEDGLDLTFRQGEFEDLWNAHLANFK